MRENLVHDARDLAHHAEFLRRRDALRDDRIGLDQRIVVGVVLEKELDHARDQDRAARDARPALHERAGGDAAHDDFERNHLRAPHEHLVVVVVFAAADVVRRHAAEIEQPEHARRRLGGDAALAVDLVAARAVARRNRVHLLHDEQIGLTLGFEQHLRLAARDLAPFLHGATSRSLRGCAAASRRARTGASPTCVRRIELRAHFGRIDVFHDALVAREQLRERVRSRRVRARRTPPSRSRESLRAVLGGRRRRAPLPSAPLRCPRTARRCAGSR